MQAQHGCSTALVAIAMLQYFRKQRNFQLAQGGGVQVIGVAAIQIACVGESALVETEVAMALAVSRNPLI